MFRRVLFMLALIATALIAAVAIIPGEREQWTMLIRDSRNDEALALIEARYRAGLRAPDAVLQYYKLLMSFADIARATSVLEDFVATRPRDPQALTLLAKHYGDTQNRPAELRTLERLFAASPSQPTARMLLTLYRLDGAFAGEKELLRSLLAANTIAANDAERLGLLLFARGDLEGARVALSHFDAIADRSQMLGRLALFEVLTELGDEETARAKAAAWVPHWQRAGVRRPAGLRTSSARLTRMMAETDKTDASTINCAAHEKESSSLAGEEPQNATCAVHETEAPVDAQEHAVPMQAGVGANDRSDDSSERR